jgi:nucleoid DNA-binding protein
MAGATHVAREAGLNPLRCPECGLRLDTLEAVREFFRVIIRRVRNGEKVHIKGFGVFSAKLLKGRVVKTPLMEGGEIRFTDTLVLRFHQAQEAKEELNRQAGPKRKKRNKKQDAKPKRVTRRKGGK